MGVPNPTESPTKIAAGDTLKFKISDGDFLASEGWSYSFILTNGTTHIGPIQSSADGDDHQITVVKGTTAGWTPAKYSYVGYFDHATLGRATLHRGNSEVTADAGAIGATDLRSHARTSLDAIEAVLETRATKDQLKYQIAGRSLERMTGEDLRAFRDYYLKAVAKEDATTTGPGAKTARSNRIRPRFSR